MAPLPTAPFSRVSRRGVLKGAAAAGLVIGLRLDGARADVPSDKSLNAFVRISPDSTVTLISKHMEMGQGVFTGLATILAEEMDADWTQMRAEAAPADATRYAHFVLKGQQSTGGSLSILNSWDQMRHAGGAARAMPVAAAAAAWKVPADTITVEKGVIAHAASKRSGSFGQFAAKAALLPAPEKVPFKQPADYKLIGTHLTRLDARAKSDGTALYTVDIKLPGMLTAVVRRSPRFGGVPVSMNDTAARKVPGVVNVVMLPTGPAVVATSFWVAARGRDALQVQWDDSKAEMRSTHQIFDEYRTLADKPDKVAKTVGDVDKALSGAAKLMTSTFEFPYLAHATMEPMDCVVKLTKDSCEIWSGTQAQTTDQKAAAAVAGLQPAQVTINTQLAGGGFGRRGPYDSDFTVEAVGIAKAMGADGTPIKLVWTREDDMRGGKYREMVFHAVDAGLDAAGAVVGWRQKIVGQGSLTQGIVNTPYAFLNFVVETAIAKSPVITHPWRAVDNTHTAYVTETMIDELAHAAGLDPVKFRETLLAGKAKKLVS